MKKYTLPFIFILFFILTACGKDPLEEMLVKLENANSYTFVGTQEIDGQKNEFTYKQDDNKSYYNYMNQETYSVKEIDRSYIYVNTGLKWIKMEAPIEEYEILDLLPTVKASYFVRDGSVYYLKAEHYKTIFDDVVKAENFTIEVKGNSLVYQYEELDDEDVLTKYKITVKDINKTKITLPKIN